MQMNGWDVVFSKEHGIDVSEGDMGGFQA